MQIYSVGGAVRDALLGLPVKDRDYVVTGATPEQMVALGYTPVGKDFPVFLHPRTHEEYALARTERKTAPGYKGFVFHTDDAVTLEQDLIRRDLTINAIAQDAAGRLIDPFGGRDDLQRKLFRHVSAAFAEDPVRILRVARFAARFTDFTVAAETNTLMQTMVASGEIDALVAERVWQELARGLMEAQPSRMFAVLRDCGALARLLPELDCLWVEPQPVASDTEVDVGVFAMQAVDYAAQKNFSLTIRVAALLQNIGKGSTPPAQLLNNPRHQVDGVDLVNALAQRLKMPNECRELAVMVARDHSVIDSAGELSATAIVGLIERCDGLRKPERFIDMLHAAECNSRNRIDVAPGLFPQTDYLATLLAAARSVDAGAIALGLQQTPQRIPETVRYARIEAVQKKIVQISKCRPE